jgi:hypothetical protein
LEQGALDAVIFVGGAPVPFIGKLGEIQFVRLPANPLEQIYCELHWARALRLGWPT